MRAATLTFTALRRESKSVLLKWWWEICGDGLRDPPGTKAKLIADIEAAQCSDLEERYAARARRERQVWCTITAAEVNAWLATLPPPEPDLP